MGKSKELFNREREQQSETLREFLDDTYQVAEYHANNQREVLNELFESFYEIFSPNKTEEEFKTMFNLSKNKSNEKRNI